MATKTQVSAFFQDNAHRLNPATDPIAHNTNAGLLALVSFLGSELIAVKNELAKISRKLDNIEHQTRR